MDTNGIPTEVDTETTAAGATVPEARVTMRELIEGEHGTELHTDCTCDPRNRCDACLLFVDQACDCCDEGAVAVIRFESPKGSLPLVVCAAHKESDDTFRTLPDDAFAAGGAR